MHSPRSKHSGKQFIFSANKYLLSPEKFPASVSGQGPWIPLSMPVLLKFQSNLHVSIESHSSRKINSEAIASMRCLHNNSKYLMSPYEIIVFLIRNPAVESATN